MNTRAWKPSITDLRLLGIALVFNLFTLVLPRVFSGTDLLRPADYVVGFGYAMRVALGIRSILPGAIVAMVTQVVLYDPVQGLITTAIYSFAYLAGGLVTWRLAGDEPWLTSPRSVSGFIGGSVVTCIISALGVEFSLLYGRTMPGIASTRVFGNFMRELSAIVALGPFVLVLCAATLRRAARLNIDVRSESPRTHSDLAFGTVMGGLSTAILWMSATWRREFGIDLVLLGFVPLAIAALMGVSTLAVALAVTTTTSSIVWSWASLIDVLPLSELRIVIFTEALTTTWIAAYTHQRSRLRIGLQRRIEELRDLSANLESDRETERTRLSREVHDDLGQLLTGLKLSLKALATRPVPDIERQLRNLHFDMEAVLLQAERIGTELSAEAMHAEDPLDEVLAKLAREYERKFGFVCQMHSDQGISLQPEQIHGVRQVVREALTNVARHADANLVRVHVECRQGKLQVEITDNGHGFRAVIGSTAGLGIIGMKERAVMLGGTLEIRSHRAAGTTVRLQVPIPSTQIALDS